ncbi:phage tail assembly protein [Sansalvadorimonas verongulae]|uniref:phage tail assembly protein n=1 Tax=Sansalvadorimonas verongulae TaxID=2172824 RepID=UPI0012BCC767|nr:phage tail assembly protein [Sansalvadorimonas verongulae]MTI13364.1 phage tail assembly protein [Sansalvadorimonas verongulae]
MPTAKTVTLQHPVTVGETTVTEVVIQPIKAKHLRGVTLSGDMSIDDLLMIAGRASGQSSLIIDELHAVDVFEVGDVITDFLDVGDTTGPTGSA